MVMLATSLSQSRSERFKVVDGFFLCSFKAARRLFGGTLKNVVVRMVELQNVVVRMVELENVVVRMVELAQQSVDVRRSIPATEKENISLLRHHII